MTTNYDSERELRLAAEAYRGLDIDLTDLTPSEIKYIRSEPDIGNMIALGHLADMIVSYEDAEPSERKEIETACPGFSQLVGEVKPKLIEIMFDFQSESMIRQIKAPFKLKKLSNRVVKVSANWGTGAW